MRLEGKVALVTGAASGIGRAISSAFAKEGATVACTDVDEEGVRAVAADIEAAGGKAVARKLDVSDPEEIKSVVKDVGLYRPAHRWSFSGGVEMDAPPPRPELRLGEEPSD